MTLTPLVHPRRNQEAARAARFTCRVSVQTMARNGAYSDVAGLSDLPAAYKPSDGAAPQMFEGATGSDQILLMQWYPQIRAKMRLALSFNGDVIGRFAVDDVLPTAMNTQTMLAVSVER